MIYRDYFSSPVGILEIEASDTGIISVLFVNGMKKEVNRNVFVESCIQQLQEYFERTRNDFSLPFDLRGTDFQISVWKQLLTIPFGKTISYLRLATDLGDPKALRSVGAANGRNPIAIIIPCHRVIGSDGKLVGYGGGLWRKKWLLDFESGSKQFELF